MTPFIAAMLSVAILTVPTFVYYAVQARRVRRQTQQDRHVRG